MGAARKCTALLRAAGAALGVLLVAALPVALYAGQKVAARRLASALSRGLGLPVSVEAVWGGPGPSVTIAGLVAGGSQPLLRIHRLEVQFRPGPWLRPRASRVRLVRPALHLNDDRVLRWFGRSPLWPRARPSRSASVVPQPIELVIEDGAVRLEHLLRGQRLSLFASGVTLRPGSPDRLLVGPTRLRRNGDLFFEAAALAIDLDRRRGWRPLRLALLGGSVRPVPEAALTLHSLVVFPAGRGYQLRGLARPAGRETGQIRLLATLDERGRPVAPGGLQLGLSRVALERLASWLEPMGLRVERTRVSGRIRGMRDGGAYRVEASLHLDDLMIEQPLLARQPVGPIRGEIQGTALLDPSSRQVRLQDLRLGTGQIRLAVRGEMQVEPGRARLALGASLPATPCQKLLASLPPGLAPMLAGMALEGNLGLSARLRFDSRDLERTEVDLSPGPLTCRVLVDPPRANVHELLRPVVVRVAGAGGSSREWLLGPANPHYRSLGRISPHVRDAFLAAEDTHFWTHDGFDPRQLRRAFISNLKEGRLSRGASTISQQLVKNVLLGHERTLSRKLQEAVLTWRLEQVVPKRRILELYLNLVEMGPGIHGVGQAARTYFKEDAAYLGPVEAATLAALTPSPRHLARQLTGGKPGPAMRERVKTLIRLMQRQEAARSRAAITLSLRRD